MKVRILRRWRELRLQLIPDWKQAWRFASVQVATLYGVLSLIQADVLPAIQPLVPARHWPALSAAVTVLIVLCRVLQQNLPQPKEPGQ